MKLSVVSIEKQLVRVEAEGEITMRDFRADGPDPFEALLGAGWASHRVVLNFSRVSFADSSAIGWLMTCRRAFEQGGGTLLVHSLQPRVRQVMDMLRIGKSVPLLEDERTAVAIASGSAMGATVAAPSRAAPPTPATAATETPVRAATPPEAPAAAPEDTFPAAKTRAATSRTRRRKAA